MFFSHVTPCCPPASVFTSHWIRCSWASGVHPCSGCQGRADGVPIPFPSREVWWNSATPCCSSAAKKTVQPPPSGYEEQTQPQYPAPIPFALPPDKHYGVSKPHGHPQSPVHVSQPNPQQVPISSAIKRQPKPIQQFSISISSQSAWQHHSQPDLH